MSDSSKTKLTDQAETITCIDQQQHPDVAPEQVQQRRSQKRLSTQQANDQRPRKRRRHWCDVVEKLSLQNGIETDPHRLAQRQKQIDYGRNTLAYDRFIEICPRNKRKRGDPMTPLVNQKCSKRSFLGQVISWRKQVYAYVDKIDKNMDEELRLEQEQRDKEQQPKESIQNQENTQRQVAKELDFGENNAENQQPDQNVTAPSQVVDSPPPSSANTCPGSDGTAVADASRVCDMMDGDFFSNCDGVDDIELDDHGNVISTAAPSSSDTETLAEKLATEKAAEGTQPSIFEPF